MGGGAAQDVTPAPDSGFNVRTRVHEYGGGELVLSADAVYFSNFKACRGSYCGAVSKDARPLAGQLAAGACIVEGSLPSNNAHPSALASRGRWVCGLKM